LLKVSARRTVGWDDRSLPEATSVGERSQIDFAASISRIVATTNYESGIKSNSAIAAFCRPIQCGLNGSSVSPAPLNVYPGWILSDSRLHRAVEPT
jgi:hypothetical protein